MSCPLASTYQFGCCGAPSAVQYAGPAKKKSKKSGAMPALKLHSPKMKDDVVYVTKKKKKASKKRKAPKKGRKSGNAKKARW